MTYFHGPNINFLQERIIYGTVLGGSSIIKPVRGKNCYLAMRDQNITWLNYKIEHLQTLFKIDQNLIKKDKNTFRCCSCSYPVFNKIYDIFYKDGKKIITADTLEVLDSWAWMIWFCDAGKKSKRKIYLRTHKFGSNGTEMIANYFNSLEVECNIHINRKRYEVVFEPEGAIKFLKTIAHRLPPFIIKNV